MASSSTPYGASTPAQGTQTLSPRSTEGNEPTDGSLRRKGSFSFLKRSKSRDRAASTGSAPVRKLSKKANKKMQEEQLRKLREEIGEQPPRIPAMPSQPEMQSFGGEDRRADSAAIMSNRAAGSFPQRLAQKASQEHSGSDHYRPMVVPPVPPIPPVPGQTPTSVVFESMANRGRYSYASSAISTINSPRKIRRRKDPTPFNILVIGTSGSGKSSFVNFLQSSMVLPIWKRRQSTRDDFEDPPPASEAGFPNFTSNFVETEVGGERVGVTLWDSEGLERNIIDGQLRELTAFIDSKFEDTFTEESKVARAPGFRDTHIHCVFLLLDPMRLTANVATHQKKRSVNGAKAKANSFVKSRPEPSPLGLDADLDINLLRSLKGKTTVIPVISKADTITSAHMTHLKGAVWQSLKQHGMDPLESLQKEDEDDAQSDASTAHGGAQNGFDERDEDVHNTPVGRKNNGDTEDDKFTTTSHIDSPSSTDSFTSADLNVAKPSKPTKDEDVQSTASSDYGTGSERHLLPFSIISPDPYEPDVLGRRFPWGFADPHNVEHCDYTTLKRNVFTDWRAELREVSREVWYEGWRTSRLNKKNKRNAMNFDGETVQNKIWAGHHQQPAVYQNQPWVQ